MRDMRGNSLHSLSWPIHELTQRAPQRWRRHALKWTMISCQHSLLPNRMLVLLLLC